VSYSWPVRPFDEAHPVRAYFNDPRISGPSKAFHFGVDISAPNGTPVYAVQAGQVYLEDPRAIAVVGGDVTFGYWHVVPAVAHHEQVARHQLLGHVDAPWLHVHFAERREGSYRNPLRAGALTPWHDDTRPVVTRVTFSRHGAELSANAVNGAVDVIAEAHDTPPIPVPPPWNGLPVTPARLRWRVMRQGNVIRPWHMPVDFTQTLLPQTAFDRIYAPGTRQNHANEPGRYRFYLAHTWGTAQLPDGVYELEVEASDLAGNAGTSTSTFTLANNV
jgi:murein DD-endopeptidase MepM/ murein hydrolase activator NlpD